MDGSRFALIAGGEYRFAFVCSLSSQFTSFFYSHGYQILRARSIYRPGLRLWSVSITVSNDLYPAEGHVVITFDDEVCPALQECQTT
jgi:hypothetical protein